MTGAILEATTQNAPVVLDGYIASAFACVSSNEKYRRILIPATVLQNLGTSVLTPTG